MGGGSRALTNRVYDDADIIVWACGYQSNMFPVLDKDGADIKLRHSGGQVEVDDSARTLRDLSDRSKAPTSPAVAKSAEGSESRPETCSSTDSIPNLYATGLGFGLPAVYDDGDFDGTTGRADGVAVYLKHAAATILESLFGAERIYGAGFSSWSEKQQSYLKGGPLKSPSAEAEKGGNRLCNARRDAMQSNYSSLDAGFAHMPAAPAALPVSP